jgi:hypothetical protein
MSAWPDLVRFIRQHRLEPTLTVYLEALPADPAGDRAAALRLRDALTRLSAEMEGAPPFEKSDFDACTEDLVEALPGEDHRSRSAGWGYFRASGGDRLIIPVPAGVETSASWGTGPRVVPFLRVSTPQSALVLQVDRQHARFSLLHDGVVEEIVSLEADPLAEVGSHMSAGPSVGFHNGTHGRAGSDEVQRQRREATERLYAIAVRRAVLLSEDSLPVLVGGPAEAATRILAALPASVAARSARVPDLRMETPESRLDIITSALKALGETRQRGRVDELLEEAHSHGRAATGYEQAFRAVERGAIAELIFGDSAWRAQPEAIEMLVHRALDAGASVQWVPDGVMLNGEAPNADAVIAGLRFVVPPP